MAVQVKHPTDIKSSKRLVSKENGYKFSKQVARKASQELFVQKFSCKSLVYHNCRIYANDGRLNSNPLPDWNVTETWLAAKVPKGNPYHTVTSGEMAIYRANIMILKKAGVKVNRKSTNNIES
ncbi:hypothetical protein L1987_02497 [Smallanthus sonchifolius]|uniref:Uncharacterized protein n=1 Tax=Smallanthus sonchifolius TaxID=185202 RepID=A0ACB9K7Z4_9ASTR|nr:hypothetical protein L1987_02497 [Smallanthus sonchifolius]